MLIVQFGAYSMVLMIPGGMDIPGHHIIMGFFDLLLETKFLRYLEIHKAGLVLLPTMLLVLDSKACTHNDFLGPKGNIDPRILDSILHPAQLSDDRHKLLNALLILVAESMQGVITLFIHDGINNMIGKAQENRHPGNRSLESGSIKCLMLLYPRGAKSPAVLAFWLPEWDSAPAHH